MSDINHTTSTAGARTLRRCPADNRDITIEQELVQIYTETAPGLFRYAVALIRDKETARDALQESFLRYFVARQNGQRFANPKAWLFRVLRNHLLDILKSAVNNDVQFHPNAPDVQCGLDTHFRQTELHLDLEKLLAPRELECVRLRAEGLTYDEIADVLKLRSGTIGAMLARVHKKMRQAMPRSAFMRNQIEKFAATAPTERVSPFIPILRSC